MSKFIIYLMIAAGVFIGLHNPKYSDYGQKVKFATAIFWPMIIGFEIVNLEVNKSSKKDE